MSDIVRPGLVRLHVEAFVNLDGGGPSNSMGSGFVVDAESGIILTNRHVAMRGPSSVVIEWGSSREEVLGPVSAYASTRS